MAVHRGGEGWQRRPGVRHDEPRHRGVEVVVDAQRRRAVLDRNADVAVPVRREAAHRDEHLAGPHGAAVVVDVADGDLGVAGHDPRDHLGEASERDIRHRGALRVGARRLS